MSKIKLILRQGEFSSFTSYYLKEFWQQWFDIEIYQADRGYHKDTLFVVWWMNYQDHYVQQLRDLGHKVVVDYLWECPQDRKQDLFWLQHPDWARLNECLWWRALGYHEHRSNPKISYRALMPMRTAKDFRDLLFEVMQPQLDHIMWSYREKSLPNDRDQSDGEWQRYMNPDWYDSCFCSIVSETLIDRAWCTEKSFKPMAYYHPFVVLSAPGHLDRLRSQGFVTFDNLFDESYDHESDVKRRCEILADNVSRVDSHSYDSETQRRMQHNHDHFFDKTLVESMIKNEIVDQLIAYASQT